VSEAIQEPDGLRLLAAWVTHQHALARICSDEEARYLTRAYELVLYQIGRIARGEPPVYTGGVHPGKHVDGTEFRDIYEAVRKAAKEAACRAAKEVQNG